MPILIENVIALSPRRNGKRETSRFREKRAVSSGLDERVESPVIQAITCPLVTIPGFPPRRIENQVFGDSSNLVELDLVHLVGTPNSGTLGGDNLDHQGRADALFGHVKRVRFFFKVLRI